MDLQLEKAFRFGGLQQISVIFQGFNIFSFDNFSGYQGFKPTLPATNPNFGRPSSLLDTGRRLQFGCGTGSEVAWQPDATSVDRPVPALFRVLFVVSLCLTLSAPGCASRVPSADPRGAGRASAADSLDC